MNTVSIVLAMTLSANMAAKTAWEARLNQVIDRVDRQAERNNKHIEEHGYDEIVERTWKQNVRIGTKFRKLLTESSGSPTAWWNHNHRRKVGKRSRLLPPSIPIRKRQ